MKTRSYRWEREHFGKLKIEENPELKGRPYYSLRFAKVETLEEVAEMKASDFCFLLTCGVRSLERIRNELEKNGLQTEEITKGIDLVRRRKVQ